MYLWLDREPTIYSQQQPGPVHSTPEKFENAALFIRLDLPSTLVRLKGERAPPDLGGGGGGDVLGRKNYAMPERVGIETGMQTETFIIFSSNETAIVGKIAQLKVCILNSINS